MSQKRFSNFTIHPKRFSNFTKNQKPHVAVQQNV